MLDNRLSRVRKLLPDVVAMSGASDPYQPAEEKYKNTRQCLEVLSKHKYPVHIGTKSTLITRDLDILAEIAESTWSAVSITITTTDPELARFLEPRAPEPQKRFETITKIKKARNILAGVNLMPIVPFLGDSEGQLESVVKCTKDSGADYLLFGAGMTMRDNQANWFLMKLKESYPEFVDKYLELYDAHWTEEDELNQEYEQGSKDEYKQNHRQKDKQVYGHEHNYEAENHNDHHQTQKTAYQGRYVPDKKYIKRISKTILQLCAKYQIPYRMKRFIPNDFRYLNYQISEEFLNQSYDLQMTGRPWTNLFWAGQNIQNLKESIADIAHRGELQKIRNVDQILEDRIWDILDILESKKLKKNYNKFF